MGTPAPKPANFDALTATWDDPESFARERQIYYAQLARDRAAGVPVYDITEPRRSRDDA